MVMVHEWTKSTFDPTKELEIDKIFKAAVKLNASDIHLQVGSPPIMRIKGALKPLDMQPLDQSKMVELTFPMMDQRNLDIFHRDGGADFAKVMVYNNEPWRFRVNLLTQMSKVGIVNRIGAVTAAFLNGTDVFGNAGTDFGPYMQKIPTNQFVNSNVITSGTDDPFTPVDDGTAGWYYNTSTGEIHAIDTPHASL